MARRTAEQIYRGMMRGPLTTKASSSSNQWAGRTTIESGSATITVSTTIVDSDSLILLGRQFNTNVLSGQSRALEVKSISPGNFFTLGTSDGVAIARDTAIMWLVIKTQ